MAEQISRDVVDQTLSGGEPSPSDVPASTTDNSSAKGDAGETNHIATTQHSKEPSHYDETRQTPDPQAESTGGDKDAGSPSMVGFFAEDCAGISLNQP